VTKILIVDYDLRVANYLAGIMSAIGCVGIPSDSLAAARRHLRTDPDIGLLILEDRSEIRGRSAHFLSELKRSRRPIPVIACGQPSEGLLRGAAAFVAKPLLKERLIAQVKQLLCLS
jgi:DNA-binding NtrC family response regulator